MLTIEERRLEFVKLVDLMRTAQKEFFKSKDRASLDKAKFLERQVDRALLRFRVAEHEKGTFDA